MSLFIFDTDAISLYQRGYPPILRQIALHVHDELVTTAITVEEVLGGWFTTLRKAKTRDEVALSYGRLADAWNLMRPFPALPFTLADIGRYESLKAMKLNVGNNDLRIAAIALEAGGTVVTRNLRDFRRVPGLPCEDWSV